MYSEVFLYLEIQLCAYSLIRNSFYIQIYNSEGIHKTSFLLTCKTKTQTVDYALFNSISPFILTN